MIFMDNEVLKNCTLCPLECGADRTKGVGACGVSALHIAKYYLHPFEEPCISFEKGSGTIFFTGCNLRCPYCQNYEVSRAKRGKEISPDALADIFKRLEDMGAENVSLVTPTHLIPYLLPAFERYKPQIPVVYNSSGYEKVSTLEQIAPFVDIWLPDMKFYSPTLAKRYLGREDYFDVASQAIAFIAKQPLKTLLVMEQIIKQNAVRFTRSASRYAPLLVRFQGNRALVFTRITAERLFKPDEPIYPYAKRRTLP